MIIEVHWTEVTQYSHTFEVEDDFDPDDESEVADLIVSDDDLDYNEAFVGVEAREIDGVEVLE